MIKRGRQTGRHSQRQPNIMAGLGAILRAPRAVLTLVVGVALAAGAFAQTASQNGIVLSLFRPLGTNFYAWRAEQRLRDIAYLRREGRIEGARYVREGRTILAGQPLSPRALRMVGWGFAAQNDMARARAAMLASNQISRRDPLTQDWLFRDYGRRGNVAATLNSLDILLRTEPTLRNELLLRIAGVLQLPDARAAIRPMINDDNPWIEELVAIAAARLPRVAPLAQLALEQRRMPDSAPLRQSYARMVERLVTEREFALLTRVYPTLPGVNRATMASLSLTPDQFDGGYAPLTWNLAADSDWGSAQIPAPGEASRSALEFFAQPGTRGVTASKLLVLSGGAPQQMRWRVLDRAEAPGAEAYWQLTCLDRADAPMTVRSVNLFTVPAARNATLALPTGCRIVRADMIVAGGSGRDPATLVVGDIVLGPAAGTASRATASPGTAGTDRPN